MTRRSRRTIPLASIPVEALHRQREWQAEERLRAGSSWQDGWGDLVFREPDGSPLKGKNATTRLQAQLARLGLPRIRFYDLRHSAATFLALSGVPVATAMAVLGHSTASTTLNVYTHVARSSPVGLPRPWTGCCEATSSAGRPHRWRPGLMHPVRRAVARPLDPIGDEADAEPSHSLERADPR
jgi:hypothetical protein